MRTFESASASGLICDKAGVTKIVLYAGVGLVQTFLLLVMVRYLTFLSGDDKADLAKWSPVLMHAVFWMTYLCAALLGLLVSTLANSQEVAVATLPILVLPQLLFTGVATGLDSDRDGSFRSIVVLKHRLEESSRGFMGWLLELLSMTMYSRPRFVCCSGKRMTLAYLQPLS